MLLLHLSDIHFRYPDCNTPYDSERPFRTSLVRDVREQVALIGVPVTAILVGGDIAYQGLPAEYKAAFDWLREIADACGCEFERIFVVPGNHDVDRNVIKNSAAVRNVQQAIDRAEHGQRAREMREQLADEDTGRSLFAPLAAYNVFAANFNCQVYSAQAFWQQDLEIDPRTKLRIYGLTSTLLSGAGIPKGQNDAPGRLYLSPLQTVLDPVDDVVNLVLCHHPPDWFLDNDDVEDAIRGRSEIHMFGHKHRQRITRDPGFIRFSAGAVNPDHNEPGWQPGYNLVQLSIEEEGAARFLDVQAHLREWQTNPDLFRPRLDAGNQPIFRQRLRVRGALVAQPMAPAAEGFALNLEASMSDPRTRGLVLRFWVLRSSSRRDIALRLGLINPEDMRLPEPERYGKALMRARENGLLDRVADEIVKMESHDAQ